MTGPLSPAVQAFARELTLARGEVASFRLADARPKSPDGDAQLKAIRDSAASELDALEHRVTAQTPGAAQDNDAATCTRLAWRLTGRHVELAARLNAQWFTIDACPSKADPALIDDVSILSTGVPIPVDAGLLKKEMDTTLTIIKSVMNERRTRIGNRNRGARMTKVRDD